MPVDILVDIDKRIGYNVIDKNEGDIMETDIVDNEIDSADYDDGEQYSIEDFFTFSGNFDPLYEKYQAKQ